MNHRYIILLCIACLVVGCGTQKQVTTSQWHTLRMTNAATTIEVDASTMEVMCTIQAVRDSFIAISVLPMMGIEMLRVEMTPQQITVIDKINHRYAQSSWKEAATMVIPRLRWDDIQSFIEGKHLTESVRHALGYTYQGHRISVTIENDAMVWNEPIQLRAIRLNRYQKVSLSQLLQR